MGIRSSITSAGRGVSRPTLGASYATLCLLVPDMPQTRWVAVPVEFRPSAEDGVFHGRRRTLCHRTQQSRVLQLVMGDGAFPATGSGHLETVKLTSRNNTRERALG